MRGLRGVVARRRVGLAVTLAVLLSAPPPALADDRQLLQTNVGAKTNVLVILDSSGSMTAEFSDRYYLPAYMDDFIYPQGTSDSRGSKIGVAKSVLREVMARTTGVNWAFAQFRNPNQTFGASDLEGGARSRNGTLDPIGGAKAAGEYLQNGGLEWLYFADTLSQVGPGGEVEIRDAFDPDEYPDLQQGRFLQLGHKVMHNYGSADSGVLADTRYPYNPVVNVPVGPPTEPRPGSWRGAFGPHGDAQVVVYRNPQRAGFEVRMRVVEGRYGDPALTLEMQEWGPVNAPTRTITPTRTSTRTPTFTRTPTRTRTPTGSPTNTRTATATRTPSFTRTITPTRTTTFTPTQTFTPTNTRTATSTRTPTPTRTNTPTRTDTRTPTNTFTPSNTRTPTNTRTSTPTRTDTRTPTITFTPSNTF
ncbi:MAG TPA: hypothetical protein VLG15_15485, partial [Thermoanaerobaculia bacterium]|nr:hypothetical protein [Thermoanaerobaculia bacterium]